MPNQFTQIPMGRPDTLEALAELYSPMARFWAFKGYNESRDAQRSLDDLVQDAWIGIMEAWYEWTPGRGAVFRTYANDRARWAILNGQRQVDAALARVYVNMIRSKDHNKDRATLLYSNVLAMGSLDQQTDCGTTVVDLLPDPTAELEGHERRSWAAFLTMLDMVVRPRTRQIVMLHFGQGLTLAEIGRQMGVSRERVRQILVEGKRDIKKGLGAKK